ncbi:MAG TPA: hypothetical protein DEQ39_05040 [Atlantibacter hermannii]|nr:hypothetical protein [Enterobacteriaceae bacterium]HCC10222.1 hypothetical protein [Atlantibacter hermannii]
MLRTVTGARSVGSELRLTNQTSGESIGPTRVNVASLFNENLKNDHRNEIGVAKLGPVSLTETG